jgi:hypothetical protein
LLQNSQSLADFGLGGTSRHGGINLPVGRQASHPACPYLIQNGIKIKRGCLKSIYLGHCERGTTEAIYNFLTS